MGLKNMTLLAQPDIFNIITNFESLYEAYRRARLGKQGKPKICEFDFY